MIWSTFLRQLVSTFTILMLVWCQTSAAAQGISVSAPATETIASPSCHQTTTDTRSDSDSTQKTDCQTRCQSHNAWFETAKIHLPTIIDLPFAVVSIALLAPVTTCAAPNDQTAERAAPPPLILVYGRLLI